MAKSTPIEERIRARFDGLSPSHRRLVEYLLQQDSDGVFLTARQLADTLGISESTVVRLAPVLGYDGFHALKSELRQRLMSRMGWQSAMDRAIQTLPRDAGGVLAQVLANDIESIQSLSRSVGRELFERAVTLIRQARTVYFIGMRTLAPHALYGTMRLRLVRHRTRLLSSM